MGQSRNFWKRKVDAPSDPDGGDGTTPHTPHPTPHTPRSRRVQATSFCATRRKRLGCGDKLPNRYAISIAYQILARYLSAVPAGENSIPVGEFIINQAPWASHYESATYGSALSGPGYVHTPGLARHWCAKVALRLLRPKAAVAPEGCWLRPKAAVLPVGCCCAPWVDHTVRPAVNQLTSDRCRCGFVLPGTRTHVVLV